MSADPSRSHIDQTANTELVSSSDHSVRLAFVPVSEDLTCLSLPDRTSYAYGSKPLWLRAKHDTVFCFIVFP